MEAKGFATVSEFARHNIGASYVQLARSLGDHVAAAQLEMLHFDEARKLHVVREMAKEYLARSILSTIKHGWNKGLHFNRMQANAASDWITAFEFRAFMPELTERARAVWAALKENSPPDGWRPTGPDDPYITAAFDKVWPDSRRTPVRRIEFGLLCPRCSALLQTPPPTVRDLDCYNCGEKIELV